MTETELKNNREKVINFFNNEEVQRLINANEWQEFFKWSNSYWNLLPSRNLDGDNYKNILNLVINSFEYADVNFLNIEYISLLTFAYIHFRKPVIIPNNVEVISGGAFKNAAISNLYLPKSLSSIEIQAFNSPLILHIEFEGTATELLKISKPSSFRAGTIIKCSDGDYKWNP